MHSWGRFSICAGRAVFELRPAAALRKTRRRSSSRGERTRGSFRARPSEMLAPLHGSSLRRSCMWSHLEKPRSAEARRLMEAGERPWLRCDSKKSTSAGLSSRATLRLVPANASKLARSPSYAWSVWADKSLVARSQRTYSWRAWFRRNLDSPGSRRTRLCLSEGDLQPRFAGEGMQRCWRLGIGRCMTDVDPSTPRDRRPDLTGRFDLISLFQLEI